MVVNVWTLFFHSLPLRSSRSAAYAPLPRATAKGRFPLITLTIAPVAYPKISASRTIMYAMSFFPFLARTGFATLINSSVAVSAAFITTSDIEPPISTAFVAVATAVS